MGIKRVKKAATKSPKKVAESELLVALRKALAERSQDELIETIVGFAKRDTANLRELSAQFDVELSTAGLVEETQHAILDATDFDEREFNHNFDYDYQAYATIQRNLKRLVAEKRFDDAMSLSLELMRQGSYQVESSDEGLMTEDIADCLKIVISALQKSDVPPPRIVEWCAAMQQKDRVGFICDQELKALQKRFTK